MQTAQTSISLDLMQLKATGFPQLCKKIWEKELCDMLKRCCSFAFFGETLNTNCADTTSTSRKCKVSQSKHKAWFIYEEHYRMGGHVTEFESMSRVIPDSVQGFDIIQARCKKSHLSLQKLEKKKLSTKFYKKMLVKFQPMYLCFKQNSLPVQCRF